MKFDESLVVQSNDLVQASCKLNLHQQKFIRLLASKIRKDDTDFKSYDFKISELMKIFDIKDNNAYSKLRTNIRQIQKEIISIWDSNRNVLTELTILSKCEYNLPEGNISVQFHPDMKPHFLKLSIYTKYKLCNVLKFKHNYSLRLYELLKQYEKLKERTIDFNMILKWFNIEDTAYSTYADFKRRVLLQAQKEINGKTDIKFSFEEIKQGRKVISIKFIIEPSETKMEPPKTDMKPKVRKEPIPMYKKFDQTQYPPEFFAGLYKEL